MTITIRRVLSRAALPLMLILGFTVQAQTEVVRNVDGSVSITIDGQEVTISATLADSIIDALRENAGDPQALQAAVQAIVADNAGGENRAALASTITAFAAFMSSGDSEVVTAIVSGAAAANPAVSTQDLLRILPETTAGSLPPPQPETTAGASPPQPGARSTAENPQQVVSPAG